MKSKCCNIKLILLGDSGVGKTSLIKRKEVNTFNNLYTSTIGVDFTSFTKTINKTFIRVHIWDTGGQEKFKGIIKSYFRDVDGVLLVYDITNKKSFNNLNIWSVDLDYFGINDNVILVGCKAESEKNREVPYELATNFAENNNFLFKECSAKNNINIEELFNEIIEQIYSNIKNNMKKNNSKIYLEYDNYENNNNKSCCNIL